MEEPGFLTCTIHGKLAGEILCVYVQSAHSMHNTLDNLAGALTVVPVHRRLVKPRAPRCLGQDAPGMEADDLHVLRIRVVGNELQQQRARVLGQAVGGMALALTHEVVDGTGRDVDEELHDR